MAASDIRTQALQAREAALAIAQLPTAAKDALLRAMAQALEDDAEAILAANARDIEAAAAKGTGSAMLDRLRLDPKRLRGVADALREVADLPDPVGQVTRAYDRPNGIHVAIIASDYARSRHFYTQVLGLPVVHEMYRAERQSYKLDLQLPNGTQLELFSFPSPPPRPSYPEACGLRHLALRVADMDASVAWLAAHGVAVEPVRTDPVTSDLFTFFADPDGLPIELVAPSGSAAPGVSAG